MARTIALRTAAGLATLWAVSALIFLGTNALPGDAATAALGKDATPSAVKELRRQFNLDEPALDRYGSWLSGILHGDLGQSIPSGQPVSELIGSRLRNTTVLALGTILLFVPLSVGIGVLGAVRRGSVMDHLTGALSLAAMATPEFVVGTLLVVVFAAWLGLLSPISTINSSEPLFSQLSLFVLPLLTLLAASAAQSIRMVRALMIEVLDSDYIEMARLKGVPERAVLFKHALPNALAPTITIIAFNVAWLTGGIVVVESVFQFPGVGAALASAVSSQDLPTLQALGLLIAAVYIVTNLLADVAVMLLTPRLRHGR
jgi:peptide/nickel transport system permease protein